ncbi:unnamed protein product [Linum tenue]|uniref:Uncharacterized protein n=1 Tax=Linum tenue TaxID=586396 RepID=A0AAV0IMS0_9ROSI|nr:unnamed protein product [Linum tenue]
MSNNGNLSFADVSAGNLGTYGERAIALAVKEMVRYGLFLGTFAGTFVSVDEIITALGGHRRQVLLSTSPQLSRTGKWRALCCRIGCGAIHTDARCCVGFPLWDQEQAGWQNLEASYLEARRHISNVPLLFANLVSLLIGVSKLLAE